MSVAYLREDGQRFVSLSVHAGPVVILRTKQSTWKTQLLVYSKSISLFSAYRHLFCFVFFFFQVEFRGMSFFSDLGDDCAKLVNSHPFNSGCFRGGS